MVLTLYEQHYSFTCTCLVWRQILGLDVTLNFVCKYRVHFLCFYIYIYVCIYKTSLFVTSQAQDQTWISKLKDDACDNMLSDQGRNTWQGIARDKYEDVVSFLLCPPQTSHTGIQNWTLSYVLRNQHLTPRVMAWPTELSNAPKTAFGVSSVEFINLRYSLC